ncbi:hypothetical protein [Streptomyces sp. NPDC048411]|uniref:hypothetical protein n=1 Tax=unclassified Streptomyces TaxID=2593676 RepID=UPI0034549C8B
MVIRALKYFAGKYWSGSRVKNHNAAIRLHRFWTPAAYTLTFAALASCTAEPSFPEASTVKPRPSMSATNSVESNASVGYTFRLPIAKYSYSDLQIAEINAAENLLTERCMRKFGIEYRVPPAPRQTSGSDRRYGLSSAADADRYGYHLPPNLPAYNPAQDLGVDEASVLLGVSGGTAKTKKITYHGTEVPAGGCWRTAARSLASGHEDKNAAQVASDIAYRSYQESANDARVQTAVSEWSSCMKIHGFDYSSPMAALGDSKFFEKRLSAGEIKTAKADMGCKKETNLLNVWFSIESSIQRGMIVKQSKILERLHNLHLSKVAAAQKITSGNH